jgi:hypothetical protein
MSYDRPPIAADLAVGASLVASATVIAWPILAGGYLTYLDNPVHMAEVYDAAFEARGGWSEIAFCGFPIHALHSPLWYGLLAHLVRAGLPAGALYAACVWFGYLAPALAMYAVARRRIPPWPAAVPAYLLLVQYPAIVGVGSALGGMWTFFLAVAALILLADRLSRPAQGRRQTAWIAALVAFILSTHLYAVVPLAMLAVLHAWIGFERRRFGWREVLVQAAAGALGMMAAAWYWMPLVLARESLVIRPQNLGAVAVLAQLFLPASVLDLVNGEIPDISPSLLLQAVPMVALFALAAAGTLQLGRRRDDAPLYGALLAALILVLLVFVTSAFAVKALGPGSWRMLDFARVGLAFACLPFLERSARGGGGRADRLRSGVFAVAAVGLSFWFAAPLRAVVPSLQGPEMAEVRGLWEWLSRNRSDDWGRVYLQDTFERPRAEAKLSQSHVLALTAQRTGVYQLGAGYGISPFRTVDWTPSEFGTLFRRYINDHERVGYVKNMMWGTNATHLVTCDARVGRRLEASAGFEVLHRVGRFVVFRLNEIECRWADPLTAGVDVLPAEFAPGHYRLVVRSSNPSGRVLVKSSYHPHWRVAGPPGLKLRPESSGLMGLEGMSMGETEVSLDYRAPRWPFGLSTACWIAIVVLVVAAAVRPGGRRRRGAPTEGV